MTIQDLGSLGELVAAVATVATLVYLAVQIRQNTRALRAGTFQQVVDSFAAISLSLSHDREIVEIIVKVRKDPQSLSEVEEARYSLYLISFVRRGENLYFQYQQGTLDPAVWEGIRESFLLVLREPFGRGWWQQNGFRFNSKFREFIDQNLGTEKPEAAA